MVLFINVFRILADLSLFSIFQPWERTNKGHLRAFLLERATLNFWEKCTQASSVRLLTFFLVSIKKDGEEEQRKAKASILFVLIFTRDNVS